MDRKKYLVECSKQWGGRALADARANWATFERLRNRLWLELAKFKRDPFFRVDGAIKNPDGRLSGFLWAISDKFCQRPGDFPEVLDFEEHFQKFFLRRGLLIYCKQILDDIDKIALHNTRLMGTRSSNEKLTDSPRETVNIHKGRNACQTLDRK